MAQYFSSQDSKKIRCISPYYIYSSNNFNFLFFTFQIKDVLKNAGLMGGLVLSLNKVKGNSLKEIFKNQTIKNVNYVFNLLLDANST